LHQTVHFHFTDVITLNGSLSLHEFHFKNVIISNGSLSLHDVIMSNRSDIIDGCVRVHFLFKDVMEFNAFSSSSIGDSSHTCNMLSTH